MKDTVTDVRDVPPIGRAEALALAAVEHGRMLALLRALDGEQWERATDCAGWTVTDVVRHLLGSAESVVSLREFLHQARLGVPAARRAGRPPVDGVNGVQVRERAHLSPDELVDRLEALMPRVRRRMATTPALVRRIPLSLDPIGRESVGYLQDRVSNRDVWLHRVDVSRACGLELELTPGHDGRLVADVVADWAPRHGEPFRLQLTGPAGGTYVHGSGGQEHRLDAVEFCRILSGRAEAGGVLAHPMVF